MDGTQQNTNEFVVSVLISVLSALPDAMRVILLLNVYDGLRTMEIAMMMNCDIRIVRSLRERAFRFLEKQLAAKQLAMDRKQLTLCVRKAYETWIEEQEPDPSSVSRVRMYMMQLVAG